MDIVIPLGKGSQNDNLELRYCLRSIEKYVADRGNIFVIGECPGFLRNVIHIPAADISERQFKQRNIYKKILAACDDPRVSDEFLWASDDHVLLKPFAHEYYYKSSLQDSLKNFTIHQTYRLTIANTYIKLQGGHDYCHCPFLISKEKFKRAMECVNWNEPYGFAIKSLYCGLNGTAGIQYHDMKIKAPIRSRQIISKIDNRLFFSFGNDAINNDLISVLNFLYPNKSMYENN